MSTSGADSAEGFQAVIVTGLSGSGKSTVVDALEDIGYFCIDNLPAALLPNLIELFRTSDSPNDRIGLGMDVRSHRFFEHYPKALGELTDRGVDVEIVFLEATDYTLRRRYSQTRRPHPLDTRDLPGGIRRERELLAPLKARADLVIDTSDLNIHQLKAMVQDHFSVGRHDSAAMSVTFQSFSYTAGIPFDADLVMDVRFLPNPHYQDELRVLTGRDQPVQDYLQKHSITGEFLQHLYGMLEFLLPHYRKEGKRYLTVAIGCTGGQHRSVAVAEWLGERFGSGPFGIRVRHRDAEASAARQREDVGRGE